MEPFRPLVDRAVAIWVRDHDPMEPLDPETKSWLIGSLLSRYEVNHEERSLFDILARTASSLAQVLLGSESRLELPEVRGPCGG